MKRHLLAADLADMPKIPRLNFFNALSGFKGVNLIGTINAEGQTNLAVFNSVIHIGSHPAYMGFMLRPLTEPRHTYENIKTNGHFTINQVHEGIFRQAHQTSAKYPAEVSEFDACGLTPWYTPQLLAPYVLESNIQIGLTFEEEHHIKANDTLIIIGKVIEIWVPENSIEESGHINLEEFNAVAVSGLDTYYRVEKLARLDYAKRPNIS
jgi:flavin reductase (DIM6/NTAB) family NADH-FMN oxidoreductase RutF